jgi:hypothetical protein
MDFDKFSHVRRLQRDTMQGSTATMQVINTAGQQHYTDYHHRWKRRPVTICVMLSQDFEPLLFMCMPLRQRMYIVALHKSVAYSCLQL